MAQVPPGKFVPSQSVRQTPSAPQSASFVQGPSTLASSAYGQAQQALSSSH